MVSRSKVWKTNCGRSHFLRVRESKLKLPNTSKLYLQKKRCCFTTNPAFITKRWIWLSGKCGLIFFWNISSKLHWIWLNNLWTIIQPQDMPLVIYYIHIWSSCHSYPFCRSTSFCFNAILQKLSALSSCPYYEQFSWFTISNFTIRYNQYDAVELVASELTAEDDQELLMKCADYFIEQAHFEKAVHLLAIGKQVRFLCRLLVFSKICLDSHLKLAIFFITVRFRHKNSLGS